MKGSNKMLALLTALVMAVGFVFVSPVAALADEAPEAQEVCSDWARLDVMMAQAAYNIGDSATYADYKGAVTGEKFAPVLASLNAAFGCEVESSVAIDKTATRGDVVNDLYNVIAAARKFSGKGSAADYFTRNGLINGRSAGKLQLSAPCTTEEMIVLAARAYEHTARILGMVGKGIFYKVTGENNTVYLLGSIHMADGSLYPLSSKVEDAFKASESLVVEADIAGISEEEMAYMQAKMLLTDGTTIKDYLSEEVYAAYAAIMGAIGVPQAAYDLLKPWAAQLTLTNLLAAGGGEDSVEQSQLMASLGIDMHFLTRAQGKDIVQIESLKIQIDMLDSFSKELQEAQLVAVLAQIAAASQPVDEEAQEEQAQTVQEQIAQMLKYWKDGDSDGLLQYLGLDEDIDPEDVLSIEYNTKMWLERNTGMANKVESFLTDGAKDGDYFVVVGAGHVIGKTGIVKQLEAKGYKVEAVK